MSSTDCFRVGHKLSYTTGHPSMSPKGGEWCLVMYRDDDCETIDDYQYLNLGGGQYNNNMCYGLRPNPYHGSYHWARVDEDVSNMSRENHVMRDVEVEMRANII